jgi:hypothetical protein
VTDDRRAWEATEFHKPVAATPPRYCPTCNRERVAAKDGAVSLCIECGESLREQAYCTVCESFWCLPTGVLCPKHDIPLEEGPPLVIDDPRRDLSVRWVTVRTFADALAAEAPRMRLEAEGIPTFVEGSRMGSRSMYHVATGGVKLQVPESLTSDARVLLSQSWSLPTPIDDLDDAWDDLEPLTPVDDLDDAWDDLAPDPGSSRRSVMKGLILPLLFVLLAFWLIGLLLGRDMHLLPIWPRAGK